MSDNDQKPMDSGTKEMAVGQSHVNSQRNAYALVQLVDEVRGLFPETFYEFSNYNGRNTAMSVTFDLTTLLDEEEAKDLGVLLSLAKTDQRILDVTEEEGLVVVDLFPSARYQDSRESFRLMDCYEILKDGSL